MIPTYNRICYRCGQNFFTDDEEGFYCDECFRFLISDFLEELKHLPWEE